MRKRQKQPKNIALDIHIAVKFQFNKSPEVEGPLSSAEVCKLKFCHSDPERREGEESAVDFSLARVLLIHHRTDIHRVNATVLD